MKSIKNDYFKIIFISFLFTFAIAIFQCVNDDFLTHISRTYNLAISFKNGNFNPYMYQSCYFKYGYPFGIFYPDTFLKPFAFLILIGIPIYFSMMVMLFCINIATLLIPYQLLKRTKWKDEAFTISLIYFLYPYRLMDYTLRFSIGELMFFVFFPFILYGLYQMFIENKFSFGLFLGFWGIVHSHILSILLLLLFLVIYYIWNIKKWNLNILKWTSINAVLVLISCIDVYLPILEAQLTEDLLYEVNPAFMGELIENAVQIGKPNIILQTTTIGFIVFLIYRMMKKKNLITNSIFCFVILFLLTTNLFPWNWFPVLNIIQFPFRFFVYGCIPWILLVKKLNDLTKTHSTIGMECVKVFCVIELILTFAFCSVYRPYTFSEMYANVGAGDYINAEVDSYDLTFFEHNQNKDENILITDYLSENGFLPVFYYGRYVIEKDGKILPYENREGLLYIDGLEDGIVSVSYKNTFIQNFSYLVGIISTIGIGIYIYKKEKRQI
mgnify:CR=1 FL=1